jgi:hypothetical protein
MSRFGMMKHLKVLEGVNLVVTRKVRRAKHHTIQWVAICAVPVVTSIRVSG